MGIFPAPVLVIRAFTLTYPSQDVGKDGGDHTALRPLDGPRRTRSDHRLPRRRFARGAAGLGHLKAHSSPIVNRQAKAAVRCPRVRADRSPADRAAVPPASAPLRRKRAVAHDVEAQLSTVVTPALGAGHPVDRVHRSRVPGGTPRFSPTISEVKATDQQRPAQAPVGARERVVGQRLIERLADERRSLPQLQRGQLRGNRLRFQCGRTVRLGYRPPTPEAVMPTPIGGLIMSSALS